VERLHRRAPSLGRSASRRRAESGQQAFFECVPSDLDVEADAQGPKRAGAEARQTQLDQVLLGRYDDGLLAKRPCPGLEVVHVLAAVGVMVGVGTKGDSFRPQVPERAAKGFRIADSAQCRYRPSTQLV